ncbi:hypothetical protein INS49_015353 [Diaporthe citri]|uniref:uncharacterized protein n=1 Tax=Diaporthe citri TaxID=83186 RepID=UPI001C7E6F73|nr:uncharacterized protein INS49_015353 [Diaporthe citri]KAG6355968.1 hypothetical protein INS49_015353 [Diaporthe citri]
MSLVPEHDDYRMTSPLNTRGGEAEVQLRKSCPSSIGYENTNALPIDCYTDAFGNTYSSSTFTNACDYDTSFLSNTWPTGAAAALDLPLAGAVYPSPIPIVSRPFDASPNGIGPMASNGWQMDAEYLMQTSPGTPWRHDPRAGSGGRDNTTTRSSILKTDVWSPDTCRTESIPHSNATTDETKYKNCADSPQPSSPRKRKKCGAAGSCQETSLKCKTSALTIPPTSTTNPSNSPVPLAPNVSFDPPDTDAHPNPIRPQSSRRAASSNDMQRGARSPPAASRSEQRARNRAAAIKCRVKTKAAAAELEATEKAESARHEHLSTTLRGLQADVFALKSEILLHGNCGDGLIQDYLNNAARSLATSTDGATECRPGGGLPIFGSTSMQLSR